MCGLSEIEQYRELIRRILEAFQDISFPVIVKVATDRDVESFDPIEDQPIISDLSTLADEVMHTYYNTPIRIKRINEVSNFLEKEIPKVFDAMRGKFVVLKNVVNLGGSGYPNLRIDYTGGHVYADVKATMRPDRGSARDFYFTAGVETKKKVTKDGKHAVLGFIIHGSPSNYRTVGWKLSDLSKVSVKAKTEFNADNLEIYKREAVIKENHI